jgi:Galactose oxidase, central domain
MPLRPAHRSAGPRRIGPAALAGFVLLLLLISPAASPNGSGPRATPLVPVASLADTATPTDAAVHDSARSPQVTTNFDWDPQPLILPPAFPINEIAGEGAVMVTSDLFGTVVLFGGEAASGLTNLTITVNESTALWNSTPVPGGPTPRANASFVTVDQGRFAVLFGGLVNLTTDATDNQTWVFDFQNRTWENRTGPDAPPPRESAAMAANLSGSDAVLEGGWDPDYTVGGAGASVTWNDTWILNLTTFNWSRPVAPDAPRPMFGSAMVYAPSVSSYLLFGGCSSYCSNTLYSYTPGGNWTPVAEGGDVPQPEGGSTEAWSPNWNISFLTGGFQFGSNTLVPLNQTYIYTPTEHRWDLVASPLPVPSPRFDSPASFLDANQCPGLFLLGGSSALAQPPADGWFMDANPDYGNGCNNWGGDQVGGTGGGPPANCTPTTFLNVTVLSSVTQVPIGGAGVHLEGACGDLFLPTVKSGTANFSAMPNETVTVTATDAIYNSNSTSVNLSLPESSYLTLELTPLPTVDIQVLGKKFPDRVGPVANASVFVAPQLLIGNTNDSGWLNLTGFAAGPVGPNVFRAYAVGYSNGSATAFIPYTGRVLVNITLLGYGAFDVRVLEAPDGTPIGAAGGLITPVGAYTFGGPQAYQTDGAGWFNTSLPQSNYSVTAAASGFVSNATRLPVPHLWINTSVVTINLTLLRGADLSVELLDAESHQPIGSGAVRVGYLPSLNTTAFGWANFTDILPPGWYSVDGSASGYEPNSTAVDLTYLAVDAQVALNLTPLGGCTVHCTTALNGTTGPFRLLPSAGTELDTFIVAPVFLVLAGALYALYVRRRAGASS